MNTKNNIPGFTAENAILKTMTAHRRAGVLDSQNDPVYIEPAMKSVCENIYDAFEKCPVGSMEEGIFLHLLRDQCGWT
jgi:hypothetical protein